MCPRNLRPIMLVLALAGCSADALTDATPVNFEPVNFDMVPTPFTASCDLVNDPPQPISPGVVRQINRGDCIIAHLGKSTYYSENIINFTTGTQSIEAIYTAANGDLLYANGSGTNQFVGPGQVAFHAQVTFEGGTGRFEDATGSATVAGQANVVTRVAHFDALGTIAY